MDIEEFRNQLARLLEVARTDPELGREGRKIVLSLLASAVVVGHRSGGGPIEMKQLWAMLIAEEYGK